MKKDVRKRLLLAWAAILCVNCAFVACDEDDDDNRLPPSEVNPGPDDDDDDNDLPPGTDDDDNLPSSKVKPGMIKVGDTNYWIESIGREDFEYSESGELVAINDYKVLNNPFRIVYPYGNDNRIYSNFSFNSSGYITNYTRTDYYSSSEYMEESYEKVSISYNKTGQIAKIVASESSVRYDNNDEDKYEYKGSDSLSFTYEDGNLVQVVQIGYWGDETWSLRYEYGYDNIDNVHGQFTWGLGHCFWEFAFWEKLAYLGLLGVPSKKLPTGLNCISKGSYFENGKKHEYADVEFFDFSYSYNDVGLISWEYADSESEPEDISYSYLTDPRTSSVSENREPSVKRPQGLRRKMNRRH